MTSYGDKNVRVFQERDEAIRERLQRKRSDGRLKAYNSATDNRCWTDVQEERKRHILELMSGASTTWGNYIPFDVLFSLLYSIATGQPMSDTGYGPGGAGRGKGRKGKGDVQELEAQKQELSDLVKALSKEGNEQKREIENLRDELERLRKDLKNCEDAGGDALKEKLRLQKDLDNEKDGSRRLSDELDGERRKSQSLADGKSKAERDAEALKKMLEDGDKALDDARRESVIAREEKERLEKEMADQLAAEKAKREAAEAAKGGKGKKKSDAQKCADELSRLEAENECLKNELERLRTVECELLESENKVQELLCELEDLQCMMAKQDREAVQMVNIIEQQQLQIARTHVLEYKLQEACKQNEMLKRQMECMQNQSPCSNNELDCLKKKQMCLTQEVNHLKTIEVQNKSLECEREKLMCKVHNLEDALKKKEMELCQLTGKLSKQHECIRKLQSMVDCKDTNGSKECKSDDSLQMNGDAYCKDMEEMQCKMQELQKKVCQQGSLIMSQRNCLLEQHKYILEQEQTRNNIQKKMRDQSRKQNDLIYERNLLRNEIMFLTTRLKTYLAKIQLLEKSIEQFFKGNCPPTDLCQSMSNNSQPSYMSPRMQDNLGTGQSQEDCFNGYNKRQNMQDMGGSMSPSCCSPQQLTPQNSGLYQEQRQFNMSPANDQFNFHSSMRAGMNQPVGANRHRYDMTPTRINEVGCSRSCHSPDEFASFSRSVELNSSRSLHYPLDRPYNLMGSNNANSAQPPFMCNGPSTPTGRNEMRSNHNCCSQFMPSSAASLPNTQYGQNSSPSPCCGQATPNDLFSGAGRNQDLNGMGNAGGGCRPSCYSRPTSSI